MFLRNPRALAFALVAAGIGLVAYHGEQRWRLPEWSTAEIEQSVELNLAIELQRRGPLLQPSGERLDQLRQTLRAEVEADIRRERTGPERWIGIGLLLIVVGLGHGVGAFMLRRAPPR